MQKRLTGQDFLREITIQADAGVDLRQMVESVEALLRERHGIPPGGDDDFLVRTLDEMAGVLTQTTDTMTYLLAGIAAVSLLVGGIGIMNIMLVSVTERTREIGLRLSVGARDIDVLLQFLTEAMVLSLTGGAIGVGARLRVGADHDAGDVVVHAGDGRCRPVVVWLCGGDRNLLRLLPGEEGGGAGPDRRAALRVARWLVAGGWWFVVTSD